MRWDEMMRRTVGVKKKCRRPRRLLVDIGSITRRSWNMITEKMKTEKEEGREETEDSPLSLLTILVSRPTGVTLFPLIFFCSDDQEDTPQTFWRFVRGSSRRSSRIISSSSSGSCGK